jgi:DNA repair exonuclease SbcCD ATPase subunit
VKIQRLILQNFRSHRSTQIELERLTIIRGPNGAGKSSIQDALEFLFTGATRQTDAGGRGADLLLYNGPANVNINYREMVIQARTESFGISLQRHDRATASPGNMLELNAEGKRILGDRARTWLSDCIAPLPVLQAVLSSGRFLSLPEKEQKNLLAAALASKPVPIPEDLYKTMRAVFADLPAILEVEDAAAADRLHKRFYDARTQLNRDIKNLGELTQPEILEDMPDATKVREQLNELHRERDSIVTQLARKRAEHKASHERLATARQQFDAFVDSLLTDEDADRLRKVVDPKNVKKCAELDAAVADMQSLIRDLEKRASDPGVCPACERPLDREESKESIGQKLADNRGILKDLQAKRLKLGDPSHALQKLDAHKKAVVASGSAERDLKQLANLPEAPDLGDLPTKLEAIDERIGNGNSVLAEVQRLEGAQKQYQQAADRKQKLAQQVMACETVIDAFAPGGPIRAQLVGDRFQPFVERVNDSLSRFGFTWGCRLEPFEFRITALPFQDPTRTDLNHWLVPKQLSESEQLRFSIAFQVALAEATGVNFVVIDRSDMLLPALRSDLAALLLESNLDQAIVLVAAEPETMPYPDLPEGVRIIDIEKTAEGFTRVASETTFAESGAVEEEEMPR